MDGTVILLLYLISLFLILAGWVFIIISYINLKKIQGRNVSTQILYTIIALAFTTTIAVFTIINSGILYNAARVNNMASVKAGIALTTLSILLGIPAGVLMIVTAVNVNVRTLKSQYTTSLAGGIFVLLGTVLLIGSLVYISLVKARADSQSPLRVVGNVGRTTRRQIPVRSSPNWDEFVDASSISSGYISPSNPPSTRDSGFSEASGTYETPRTSMNGYSGLANMPRTSLNTPQQVYVDRGQIRPINQIPAGCPSSDYFIPPFREDRSTDRRPQSEPNRRESRRTFDNIPMSEGRRNPRMVPRNTPVNDTFTTPNEF